MEDFNSSLEAASIRQRWVFDDRWSRIGNPYLWVCGSNMQNMLKDQYAALQALSMYYEEYPTVESLRIPEYEDILKTHERVLANMVEAYFPFLKEDSHVKHNIKCTALTRAQDYCFIRKYCPDLPANPTHLDVGPGLGTHAIYSLFFEKGRYLGLEAAEWSYSAQRQFFRFLAGKADTPYYDPIVAEKLNVAPEKIAAALNDKSNRLLHLPSWYAEDLNSNSVDLVTATWVLNEVAPAGITWLMSHAMRTLKKGGYFYIRDSRRLKPNRHSINYDEVLMQLGFEKTGHLDVKNRVDMFGFPRSYRKTKDVKYSFEQLFDKFYGKFSVTTQPGEYMQIFDANP